MSLPLKGLVLFDVFQSETSGVQRYLCCFEVWSRPSRSIRSSSRCRWCACSVPGPHTPGTCRTPRPPPTAPSLDSGPAGRHFLLVLISDEGKRKNREIFDLWRTHYFHLSTNFIRATSENYFLLCLIILKTFLIRGQEHVLISEHVKVTS